MPGHAEKKHDEECVQPKCRGLNKSEEVAELDYRWVGVEQEQGDQQYGCN